MIKNVPDALVLNPTLCKDNFAVYSEKYGEEKAIGLVTRNPFILSVPTTGYGSAETAGGETMVMSYIIAYTRPFGKIFLAALFIALGKAVFINSGMIDQILK